MEATANSCDGATSLSLFLMEAKFICRHVEARLHVAEALRVR